MATKKVISSAKAIRLTPWKADGSGLESTALDLDNIIADTVAISQDDPETNDIGCETRDEPLYSATTQGAINITMDSADVNPEILKACMGFTEDTVNKCYYAPMAYKENYAQIEVEFDNDILVLPRVLLNSKFDASTLKTGVAKGTIAGKAQSCDVKVGSAVRVQTPFFVIEKTNGVAKSWTVAQLNKMTVPSA